MLVTKPDSKLNPKLLGGLLLLALVVRLVYLVEYSSSPVWEQLTVDNWYHHNWALSLAGGNFLGDTTYFRAPLYVYILGLLYAMVGSSLWVARLFGLGVGLLSVGMTYLTTRRLAGNRAAIVAAILHALYPIAIYFESELLLDPLYTLLLQVAVYALIRWSDEGRTKTLFWAGLALGLAAITRPIALALLPIVLIWLLLRVRTDHRGSWVICCSLFLAGTVLPIIPVAARNLAVADDPVLIASQGGINFYIGNNETADGMSATMPEPMGHNWQIRQITYMAENAAGHKLKPGEVSSYWRNQALEWIWDNPGKATGLFFKKLGLQFLSREISNNRALDSHLSSFGILRYNPLNFAMILGLACIGLLGLWRDRRSVRLIALVIMAHTIVLAIFFFNSRFRLPLLPFYFALSGAGLVWFWEQAAGKWGRNIVVVLGAIGVAILSFVNPIPVSDGLNAQSLSSKGLFHYHRGELDKALHYFEQAVNLTPNFPEVNLNLGTCYLKMGRADKAEQAFQKEVELHPQRAKGYANLSSLYLVQNRPTLAVDWAAQAVTLAPYDPLANTILLRALGADPTAYDPYLDTSVDRAAAGTNNDLWVMNEGATQMVARGRCDRAMTWLLKATMATPPPIETDDLAFGPNFRHTDSAYESERASTYYLLGYCTAVTGDIEAAVSFTKKALDRNPEMPEAWLNLAVGYRSLGRLVEADSVMIEAAERFPQSDLFQY